MTRLLLITEDQPQALTLSEALSSSADFQTVHKVRLADARGALAAGAFEAAVLLPARADTEFCDELASVRAQSSALVLVVVLPAGTQADGQTRVLTAGADSVLFQPADVQALAAVLTRLTARATASQASIDANAFSPAANRLNPRAAALSNALEVLRDFSQVLTYSLDYRQLTQHFTLKLREVIGLTRIAIFLEPGAVDVLPDSRGGDDSRLACAAAVGLPADLVECFALSRRSGIGRQLSLQPQILRAPLTSSAAPFLDPKIAREFEVLGGRVAIPVNDRERTIGVAVLGGRITGGDFSDEELLLIYHLLEELGLAVKNSWLHHQLVGSHRLLGNVLNGLTVGALVVGPHQQVVYANRTLVTFLGAEDPGSVDLATLPPGIAQKLHDVVENGLAVEPFFHEMPGSAQVYRVTIIPVHATAGKLPRTSLLLLEDFTQIRAAQRVEIDSSNLKLISVIARRFAHEIRNSLVPLTTHAQLFDTQIGDAEFRGSLKTALTRETQRIQRFTDQMLLLARSDQPAAELASLEDLLRGSFEKSRVYAGGEGTLEFKNPPPPVWLRCNRSSLSHAFQEIFLNGLQSGSEGGRRLSVAVETAPAADGPGELLIHVHDSGAGFAADSAPRATEPFFTTRNTGVGLGLTIARRVIEAHRGRLEVHTRATPGDPDVTVRLPLPR